MLKEKWPDSWAVGGSGRELERGGVAEGSEDYFRPCSLPFPVRSPRRGWPSPGLPRLTLAISVLAAMDTPSCGSLAFRPVTMADCGTVLRLYAQICADCGNIISDLPAVIAETNAIRLLLEVDGQPAGMILGQVRTSLSAGRHVVIDDLVVDTAYRRRGLGRALLEHVIALAKSAGCNSVDLDCSHAKSDLHGFYEHLGFRHRMRHYSMFLR